MLEVSLCEKGYFFFVKRSTPFGEAHSDWSREAPMKLVPRGSLKSALCQKEAKQKKEVPL
jgi:hypothetical protein